MTSLLRIFTSRRMAAMLTLGFASGMPALVISDNLQLWMKDAEVSNTKIGLLSLIGLPFVFKFAWAPLMDRFAPPLLGRRRGWMLLAQLLLAGCIARMAFLDPQSSLFMLAYMALIVAFLSASQDIVADAYRTDVLNEVERAPGTAIWVTGYRIAMIAAGSGALLLVKRGGMSWSGIYLLSAAAMGLGAVATLLAPEPSVPSVRPPSLAQAVIEPLKGLLLRPGGWFVLLFVVFFKVPDALARTMTLPFMKEIGVDLGQIATIRQGLGLGVTIVGTLLGGGIVARLGLRKSLWLFGILQAVSNLGFCALAKTGPVYGVMVSVVVIENLCAGLVTAGFLSFLMSQCQVRFSAFQFALLSSVMRLTDVVSGAPSGYLADKLGWTAFFLITVASALPGMALLPWLKVEQLGQARAEDSGLDVVRVADAA